MDKPIKYIKLISDGTWFKKNTEVYHYDENRRFTMEEFEECKKDQIVNGRGIRVSEGPPELHPIGEEYIDGETCMIDEFTWEIVNEITS